MKPLKRCLAFYFFLIGFQTPSFSEQVTGPALTLDRNSEIILAVRGNLVKRVDAYLSAGGNVNARTTGEWANGSTLLHHAADSGSFEVVKILIQSGADVEARNIYQGATPLHRAAIQGHTDVIRLLLEQGAQINALTGDGETPLFESVTYGRLDVVRLLLRRGGRVNHTQSEHGPPIMKTVSIGDYDVVPEAPYFVWTGHEHTIPTLNLLIDHGANINARNKDGYTLVDQWVKTTCLLGHPSGSHVVHQLLDLDAAFTISLVEKYYYLGSRSRAMRAKCIPLLSIFERKIGAFSDEPSEIFVEEINELLAKCQNAWAVKVAQRIVSDENGLTEAIVRARLFGLIAREHAAAHNLPRPAVTPIPSRESIERADGLSAEWVADFDLSPFMQEACTDTMNLSVSAERLNEIEAEIRKNAGRLD